MRLGILGGTFDPVHSGHIMMAERAHDELNLDKVFLIPAGNPMSKKRDDITSAEHRLRMLELAKGNNRWLEVSGIEIERQGPTYTMETIEQLRNSGYENDDIYFIVGMDNLEQIHTWHRPGKLIEMCMIATITRPGYRKPDNDELERRLKGLSERIVYIEGMERDISGTGIREKIQRGEPLEGLVPEEVENYIRAHRLYRGG